MELLFLFVARAINFIIRNPTRPLKASSSHSSPFNGTKFANAKAFAKSRAPRGGANKTGINIEPAPVAELSLFGGTREASAEKRPPQINQRGADGEIKD